MRPPERDAIERSVFGAGALEATVKEHDFVHDPRIAGGRDRYGHGHVFSAPGAAEREVRAERPRLGCETCLYDRALDCACKRFELLPLQICNVGSLSLWRPLRP